MVVSPGNFNTSVLEWDSQTYNTRGRGMLEAVSGSQLTLVNGGRRDMFTKTGELMAWRQDLAVV